MFNRERDQLLFRISLIKQRNVKGDMDRLLLVLATLCVYVCLRTNTNKVRGGEFCRSADQDAHLCEKDMSETGVKE